MSWGITCYLGVWGHLQRTRVWECSHQTGFTSHTPSGIPNCSCVPIFQTKSMCALSGQTEPGMQFLRRIPNDVQYLIELCAPNNVSGAYHAHYLHAKLANLKISMECVTYTGEKSNCHTCGPFFMASMLLCPH